MDLIGRDFLTLLDFTPAEIGSLLESLLSGFAQVANQAPLLRTNAPESRAHGARPASARGRFGHQ